MEYRAVMGDGRIYCLPCSKNCRGGCWKGDSDGCHKCLNWKVISANQTWFCARFCVGEEHRENGELICRKCSGLSLGEKVEVTEGVTITAPPTGGQQPSSSATTEMEPRSTEGSKGQRKTQIRARVGNVKLQVFYDSYFFTVNSSRPEIEGKGKYRWAWRHHIKCQIEVPVPEDGWVEFNVIRDALAPMFPRWRIQRIDQLRGVSRGREVAWVTSLPDDEVPREWEERRYCDSDGKEFTSAEVKPQWHRIRSGGKLFIASGGRRTVVTIFL